MLSVDAEKKAQLVLFGVGAVRIVPFFLWFPQPVTKTNKPASVVLVASKELVVCLE